jgi:peptide/nickel transport system permease protein
VSDVIVGVAPTSVSTDEYSLAESERSGILGWIQRWIFGTWTATVGAVLLALLLFVVVFAPIVAPHDPLKQNVKSAYAPPFWMTGGSTEYLLGTDPLGRDLLSRIIFGFRTSLAISVSAVILAVVVGLAIGLLSGYFGGWADAFLMRVTEVQMALPFIVLAVAILSLTTPNYWTLTLVLSLAAWPIYARVVRSITMVEKDADYIMFARSLGASHGRIIVNYILRNFWLSLLILSTLDVATIIIFEAVLGFLGLGVPPPTPSLGNIMADGKNYMVNAWWISTMPGIAIVYILLALNLLGLGLQEKLDPRIRH